MIKGLRTAARRLRFGSYRNGRTARGDATSSGTASDDPIKSARTARALAEAMERAIAANNFTEAHHLADAAMPYCARHTDVRLQIARLRLAENEPEQALAMIDRDYPLDDASRLLRIVCQLQTGRIDAAHIDLLRWNAVHQAPASARLLFALLEAGSTDLPAHHFTFINQSQDSAIRARPEAAVVAMSRGRMEQARRCAENIVERISPAAMDPALRLLLRSLHVLPFVKQLVSDEHVAGLADELIHHENAIAPLLEAQRHQPSNALSALLFAAIDLALPRLAEPVAACQLVADLLIERGQHDDAREWIIRGVTYGPMSLTMHLLRQQVDAGTETGQSTDAREVLATMGADEWSTTRRTKGMAA